MTRHLTRWLLTCAAAFLLGTAAAVVLWVVEAERWSRQVAAGE